MAGFNTHLTGGILSAAGVALAGFLSGSLSMIQTAAIFIVGSVGGLLPDMDSDSGKPLTLLFQLVSVLIPSIFFMQASQYGGNSPEFIICYFTISYLFIT